MLQTCYRTALRLVVVDVVCKPRAGVFPPTLVRLLSPAWIDLNPPQLHCLYIQFQGSTDGGFPKYSVYIVHTSRCNRIDPHCSDISSVTSAAHQFGEALVEGNVWAERDIQRSLRHVQAVGPMVDAASVQCRRTLSTTECCAPWTMSYQGKLKQR